MKTENIATTARALADIAVALGRPETEPTAQRLLEKLNRSLEAEDKAAEMLQRAKKNLMQIEGPRIWAEWHRRAIAGDPMDEQQEHAWLKTLVGKVPCGDCRGHLVPLLQKYFANGFTGYFEKTVAIHNEVNRRIGKPEIGAEEARQLWGKVIEPAQV